MVRVLILKHDSSQYPYWCLASHCDMVFIFKQMPKQNHFTIPGQVNARINANHFIVAITINIVFLIGASCTQAIVQRARVILQQAEHQRRI